MSLIRAGRSVARRSSRRSVIDGDLLFTRLEEACNRATRAGMPVFQHLQQEGLLVGTLVDPSQILFDLVQDHDFQSEDD